MVREVSDYNSTVFSLPFAIAVAILDGGVLTLPDHHLTYLNDRRARELIGRIRAETDPEIDRVFGAHMPTAVIVRTKDGREFRESEDTPKGKYPEKPLGEDEFLHKIRGNAGHSLTSDQINRLVTLVEDLEGLNNVAPLAELLAPGS